MDDKEFRNGYIGYVDSSTDEQRKQQQAMEDSAVVTVSANKTMGTVYGTPIVWPKAEEMVDSPVISQRKTGGIETRFKQGAKPGPGRPKRVTPTGLLNEKVPDIFIIQGYIDAFEIAKDQKSPRGMVAALTPLADRKWGPAEPADADKGNPLVNILMQLGQRFDESE